jgi:cell division septation protein DedD
VAQAQDDGFHEIQLSGKQLAFLVMAATVVSVVIFLFGVLVGRGVRAERLSSEAGPAAATVEPPAAIAPPAPLAAGEDPTRAAEAPVPPAGDSPSVVPDRPAAESHDPAKAPAAKPAEPKRPSRAESSTGGPTATAGDTKSALEPAGNGYAVQIAALNVRSEADAIAKRLISKGYSAYVLAPTSGSPSVFRVRVGKFQTRREAETVAAKLQKEEQFRPWVTR